MTDEPREENRPEDEEVEAHLPPDPQPLGDKHRGDEDEDVEAHAHAPIGAPIGDKSRGEDEDVEAHSAPIGAPLNEPDTL